MLFEFKWLWIKSRSTYFSNYSFTKILIDVTNLSIKNINFVIIDIFKKNNTLIIIMLIKINKIIENFITIINKY